MVKFESAGDPRFLAGVQAVRLDSVESERRKLESGIVAWVRREDVEIVRKVVKKEESVLRSVLMQKVASRGINKDRLDRALETLLAEESIEDHSEMGRGNKPRVWYTWEGGEA